MKSLASIKVAIRIDYFFYTMSYTLSSKGSYSYCYGSLSTGYRARTNESFPLWPELCTPPPWARSRVTGVAISSSPGGPVGTPFLDKGTSSSELVGGFVQSRFYLFIPNGCMSAKISIQRSAYPFSRWRTSVLEQRSHRMVFAVDECTIYTILVYCDPLYEPVLYSF